MATNSNQHTLQQTSRLDFLYEASYSIFNKCPALSRYYMNEFQNTLTEYELKLPKPVQRSACTSCGQIFIPGHNAKVKIVTDEKLRMSKEKKVLKKRRKTKDTSVKKNKIQYICLACQRSKIYNGSFKQKIPKNIVKNTVASAAHEGTNESKVKSQTVTATKSTTTTTALKSNSAVQSAQKTAAVTVSTKVTKTITTATVVAHNSKANKNMPLNKSNSSETTEAANQKKKKNKGKKNSLKALLAKQQQQQNVNQGSSLNDFLSSL